MRIKSPEDFWSGVLFAGFGALAMFMSRAYPMGSAMRMGPGYFPTWLGAILIVLGVIIAWRSLRVEGEGIHGWAWRPILVLGAAFAAFGYLMEHVGFIPSLIVLVGASVFAGRDFRPLEAVVLIAVLVVAAVAIFIYGIELPFQLWWH